MDIRERMMNSMILLKNGCVHNGRGQVSTTDLLIDGGKIVKIGEHLEADVYKRQADLLTLLVCVLSVKSMKKIVSRNMQLDVSVA